VATIALVTLAARITPLDRALGTERLYRWHGRLGRYAVALVLAHVTLITAGYAATGRETPGAVVLSYLADPWLRLAVVATGLLLVVGLTSAAAVRRRLPYEVWHAAHLATYAAILLGLVHQVTQGAQFAGYPAVTAAWLAATLVPVALLLVNRLVRPLIRNARQRFTLAAVIPEAPGVVSLVIHGRDLAAIPARAGQYVRVHAPAPGLRFASNPYSFSAVPGAGGWRITVAAVGAQSRALAALAPGTRLWLEGPYGGLTLDRPAGRARPAGPAGPAAHTPAEQTGHAPARRAGRAPGQPVTRPVTLIAGGVGVAPIRALAEAALAERPGVPVAVIYRVKDAADALFAREWAALSAWAGGRLAVHLRPGPRSAPGNGLDPVTLSAAAPWLADSDVLACGPADLTAAVRDAVTETGAASYRTESLGW
jgi:ferredoxin-NADP reductase/DMSO/TMAO reductase YedYZ heme-binding membrane subunit